MARIRVKNQYQKISSDGMAKVYTTANLGSQNGNAGHIAFSLGDFGTGTRFVRAGGSRISRLLGVAAEDEDVPRSQPEIGGHLVGDDGACRIIDPGLKTRKGAGDDVPEKLCQRIDAGDVHDLDWPVVSSDSVGR